MKFVLVSENVLVNIENIESVEIKSINKTNKLMVRVSGKTYISNRNPLEFLKDLECEDTNKWAQYWGG